MRYPRRLSGRIESALADTPVLLIHGPRQSGKSTLAQAVAARHGHRYLTLDDAAQLAAATEDPIGFVDRLEGPTVLDEVQRAPALFLPIKAAVDRARDPGRFILTGSANLLRMPTLSDSLAGRIEVLRLGPLTQLEIEGEASGGTFVTRLFARDEPASREPEPRLGDALARRVLAGGFPAALSRETHARRERWLREYVDALVEKDLRELFSLRRPDVIPLLLEAAAARTARLFNAADLASPFALTRPTIAAYLHHLENVFLIDRLPPWHSNRMSRLVKTPKLHVTDTGLASAVLGVDLDALLGERELYGQLLETSVYLELRRQANWEEVDYRFHHFRDKDGLEVDLVIERSGRSLCAVEVKAGATVNASDFKAIKRLRDTHGTRFHRGIVLHDGERTLSFGDRLFAMPFHELWRANG